MEIDTRRGNIALLSILVAVIAAFAALNVSDNGVLETVLWIIAAVSFFVCFAAGK